MNYAGGNRKITNHRFRIHRFYTNHRFRISEFYTNHRFSKRQECGISYLSLCRAMTSSWNRFESETKRAENPHTFTIRF